MASSRSSRTSSRTSMRPPPLYLWAPRIIGRVSESWGVRLEFLPPHRERYGGHQVAVVPRAPALRTEGTATGHQQLLRERGAVGQSLGHPQPPGLHGGLQGLE